MLCEDFEKHFTPCVLQLCLSTGEEHSSHLAAGKNPPLLSHTCISHIHFTHVSHASHTSLTRFTCFSHISHMSLTPLIQLSHMSDMHLTHAPAHSLTTRRSQKSCVPLTPSQALCSHTTLTLACMVTHPRQSSPASLEGVAKGQETQTLLSTPVLVQAMSSPAGYHLASFSQG